VRYNENDGYGSLQMFKDENILEGYWIEEGSEGFWKIELK